ncbi:MAG: FecR domain-containing protein [Candidatus Cyclobacteriaceae bacterium M2_1C_046]
MRITKSILLLIFFSICFLKGNAQEEAIKPLKDILSDIEKRYQVSFTYADENIQGITLKPPSQDLDIKEVLNYFQQHTGLHFQILDDRFIAISETEAQLMSICGFIKDSLSQQAIQGATVKSGNKFTVTDRKGFFSIEDVPADSTFTIQYLGNKTTRKNILQGSGCPVIYLDPEIITLKAVLVNNYLTEGVNKQLDGSIVMNAENMGILPGLIEPDVLQSIQALPGIQSFNETVSDINVRGGTNDQNLVTWNGIKMYQTGHFFGLISAFNPYLTDEVILIKNGTSASLGEGVSSSILINTDNKVAQNFSGSTGLNMIYGDIFTKIPVSKKASIQLSARRSITDWIKSPTYDQYFERIFINTEVAENSKGINQLLDADEDFYFYDVSLKFLYDISEKDKLRVNFLNIYNDIEYQESAVVDNVVQSKTSGLDQHSMAAGFSYSRLWSSKFKTNAQFHYSLYELDAVNFDILRNQRLLQGNEVLDIGFKLDAKQSINKNYELTGGYEFSEIGVTNMEDINNPDFSRLIKEVTQAHALFLEGNHSSDSENTNIQAGLRVNYYDKPDEVTVEPRLAVTQRIFGDFFLEVLGEYKSQVTSQVIDFQNDFLGVEKRRWVLSNGVDVPVIKSKQASAGITYNKKKFLISLEGYYKDVEGITSSSQGFQNQFQFIRTSGAYNTTGFDFLINKKLLDLNMWLSYSYAESNYEFAAFDPVEFPNNLDVRNIITFGNSYQKDNFGISLGFNWYSGRPFTKAVGVGGATNRSIVYEVPNSSQLEDYLRIDISAKYNFKLGDRAKGEIGASVWNVLDNTNTINRYYRVTSANDLNRVDEFSLGFTPNVVLRVNF